MSDWPGPVEHLETVEISNNQLWLLKVLFSWKILSDETIFYCQNVY